MLTRTLALPLMLTVAAHCELLEKNTVEDNGRSLFTRAVDAMPSISHHFDRIFRFFAVPPHLRLRPRARRGVTASFAAPQVGDNTTQGMDSATSSRSARERRDHRWSRGDLRISR
mmetsp:Transcript_11367/g.35485  ORF Transcript_11367/g.35485 Transcript_11367/m.35485 type:complete len:115 (-) Transcript_11367:131-475(-)